MNSNTNTNVDDNDQKSADVDFRSLLTQWGLAKYIDVFEDEGYDEVGAWKKLVEEDGMLQQMKDDLGMKKAHVRKFFRQVQQMKERNSKTGYLPVKFTSANSPGNDKRHRTLLLLGETGSGKTTLINSMMNYLYDGVSYEDACRYKLIFEQEKEHGQATSQTDKISVYALEPDRTPYSLTIIDSPGFGDTRGLEYDERLMAEIERLFKEEIPEIDAVCFVVNGSVSRLTPSQKYVINKVMGIFGKDIKDNIAIFASHSNSKKPHVLDALKAENILYAEIFCVNNGAFVLETKQTNEGLFQICWNDSIREYSSFFKKCLPRLESKSLMQTSEVLQERRNLEVYLSAVEPTIKQGLDILDNMLVNIRKVEQLDSQLSKNKQFQIRKLVYKTKKVVLPGNVFCTNCDACQETCHANCVEKLAPVGCDAMRMYGWGGYCLGCKNNCWSFSHTCGNYKYVRNAEYVMVTSQELKDQYQNAKKSKQSLKDAIVAGLSSDREKNESKLAETLLKVGECRKRLAKIALRPNVENAADYMHDYIQMWIEKENIERGDGFQKRIVALEQVQARNKLLGNINGEFHPFSNDERYAEVQTYLTKEENQVTPDDNSNTNSNAQTTNTK